MGHLAAEEGRKDRERGKDGSGGLGGKEEEESEGDMKEERKDKRVNNEQGKALSISDQHHQSGSADLLSETQI